MALSIGDQLELYRQEMVKLGYGQVLIDQRLAQRCRELEQEAGGAASVAPLVAAIAGDVAQGKPAYRMPTLLLGKAVGIPFRYQGVAPEQVLKGYAVILDQLQAFLNGGLPGWPGGLLHGPLGRGKTGAGCEAMKHFGQYGWSSLFTTAYDLVATVKETWNPTPDQTELEAIASFRKPSLLVVDDVGVQFGTLAERNVLYAVIVGRYNACFPTILTTNCDLDSDTGRAEFYESAGRRVSSRFEGHLHACAGWGPSLRGKV